MLAEVDKLRAGFNSRSRVGSDLPFARATMYRMGFNSRSRVGSDRQHYTLL